MGPEAELRTQLPAQSDQLSMVLPLLLLLLASLQSVLIPVSLAGLLPAPTLSVYPSYTEYLPGNWVTLTCRAPEQVKASGYRFFYQKGQEDAVQPTNTRSQLQLRAEKGRAGTYTCAYWRWESNRQVPSENSNSVSITVTAPHLTVSPLQPVYVTGEAVNLTCSAAGVYDLAGIRFFRDEEELQPQKFPQIRYRSTSIQLSKVNLPDAGMYSCEYWLTVHGQELKSERSQHIPIAVTAPLPAPQLTVSPQQSVYTLGDTVTLTCSAAGAPNVSGIWFFRDGQKMLPEELCFRPHNATASVRLSVRPGWQNGSYTCGSWRTESGREIPSERSQPISIAVTDPPPQPTLSVDPLSGVVSEGLSLLLTCTAPGDTGERRFHFYKDGVEIVPGDAGSEINATEPSTGSVNVSVTSILRAGLTNTVEFTCGYERNVSGRWVPSPRSPAVNVPRTAPLTTQDILLAAGGALLLLGALAGLLCWGWRKTRILKPLKSPEGSQPRAHTRDVDPSHDTKQSNERSTGAGAEQDSKVTYALIDFSALDAHRSPWKNKAQPAEEEHVLYSEVVTKPTRRQLNKEEKPALHSSA